MRIPAWIKLLTLAALSVLIVVLPVPAVYATAVAVVVFIAVLGASPIRLLRMLLPAIPFIVAIAALQALLQGGGDVVSQWWMLSVTKDSLLMAAVSALRMTLLYLAGSAVTATTGEAEISAVIERALYPFDRLTGLRVGRDLSTALMLAIAFIPVIYEEYRSIKMAQEARGIRYGTLRGFIPVVVPLVYSVARHADDVAMAMEARCYGLDR